MKKLMIITIAFMLPFVSSAQNFEKYVGMKGVDEVVITSKMFKLLTRIDLNADDPETQQYIDLIENLKEIRIFTTKEENIRQQMSTDVASYLQKDSLEELMRVTESDKSVKFYYKPGRNENYVSQLFMFMEGKEKDRPISVILNITGDIDLAQVSKLARDLKIPGGEELENIERN